MKRSLNSTKLSKQKHTYIKKNQIFKKNKNKKTLKIQRNEELEVYID